MICQDHHPWSLVAGSVCHAACGAAGAAAGVWEACGQDEGLLALLFPNLAGFTRVLVEDTADTVLVSASRRAASTCFTAQLGGSAHRRESTAACTSDRGDRPDWPLAVT